MDMHGLMHYVHYVVTTLVYVYVYVCLFAFRMQTNNADP